MKMFVRPSAKPGIFSDLFEGGVRTNGVHRVLRTLRKHLGMDVAFISRFRELDRVLEQVDADGLAPVKVGQSLPLERGYCLKIARGDLPELIPDTAENRQAAGLPDTSELGIGSHLGVPIRLQNGDLYGTLCCFKYSPDPTIGARELGLMHTFAEVLATHIEEDFELSQVKDHKLRSVRSMMTSTCPRIVYQPIYALKSGLMIGVECLSRFDRDLSISPGQWFEMADEVDLRQDLEALSIRRALAGLQRLPSWVYLALNASPQTVLSGCLASALEGADLSQLVIEVTEHAAITDYAALLEALQPLRKRGLRLAIDDAGAGFASMRHIISLLPDVIKLDISLVRGVDHDPVRRALARALIAFSREIGSTITAEGIETVSELHALRHLGVDCGQGYLMQKPVPLGEVCCPALQRYSIEPAQIDLAMPD